MSFFRALYRTALDALFPLSPAEEEVLAMSPEQAFSVLPRAPLPPIANVRSVFFYADERVAKLVWMIKYKKSATAAKIGAYALHQFLKEKLAPGAREPVILVPMPISKQRRRERGFNQCEVLAEVIERLDSGGSICMDSNLLVRTRHRARQTLKQEAERHASAKGIFSINADALLPAKDSNIVVVDDVITTGSTMNEAIETLRNAGFKEISGLSLAH